MERDDGQIVAQIRQGDALAFEGLFRAHAAGLCHFALRYVRDASVAEDLVHDVFCALWEGRAHFNPAGTPAAYLYRAVRNSALNWLKHQRVVSAWEARAQQQGGTLDESAAQQMEKGDLEKALEHALARLPQRQQHVYRLARQQELSYAEIAEVLGISAKTVENHMGRALKHLHAALSAFLSLLL